MQKIGVSLPLPVVGDSIRSCTANQTSLIVLPDADHLFMQQTKQNLTLA